MLLLDGKKVQAARASALQAEIVKLLRKPTLAIIQIGKLPESIRYVERKKAFGKRIGANVKHILFGKSEKETEIISKILELNADSSIDGIIVQLPLPLRLRTHKITEAIVSQKDVDGLTSKNIQLFLEGIPDAFIPATAKGVLSLLDFYDIPLESRKVVVVGRSSLVGKPIAISCLQRNATVEICHKKTKNLASITKGAQILIVAAGSPRLIGPSHVGLGQVVVDVGINIVADKNKGQKLIGDVDFEKVKNIVGALSPVPGGVGPMTVLSLFENLLIAHKKQGA